jgi:hypothetical protein
VDTIDTDERCRTAHARYAAGLVAWNAARQEYEKIEHDIRQRAIALPPKIEGHAWNASSVVFDPHTAMFNVSLNSEWYDRETGAYYETDEWRIVCLPTYAIDTPIAEFRERAEAWCDAIVEEGARIAAEKRRTRDEAKERETFARLSKKYGGAA